MTGEPARDGSAYVDAHSVRDDLRGLIDHNNWMLQSGDGGVDALALRATPAATSIVLIEPSDLSWSIEPFRFSRHYKTNFRLDRRGWYQFSVTDVPVHERLAPLANAENREAAL